MSNWLVTLDVGKQLLEGMGAFDIPIESHFKVLKAVVLDGLQTMHECIVPFTVSRDFLLLDLETIVLSRFDGPVNCEFRLISQDPEDGVEAVENHLHMRLNILIGRELGRLVNVFSHRFLDQLELIRSRLLCAHGGVYYHSHLIKDPHDDISQVRKLFLSNMSSGFLELL